MFFAKAGVYEPCGIFTKGHLWLVILNVMGVVISLIKSRHKTKEEVSKLIKECTIFVWILEIIMIIYKFTTGDPRNLNNYMPLYYCSMLLYGGLLSSFGKGVFKKIGDVVLASGTIVGGVVFLILPTTSLPTYPFFHLVSFHSFLYHGIMIYIGLLISMTNYVKLKFSDIKYYAILVLIMCLVALGLNIIFDCNLMFISKDFPGTPITILYKLVGRYFTPIMIIGQMTLPYILIYGIMKIKDSLVK